MSLPKKYQSIIHRSYLVIRIPDKITMELCKLVECRHDHPRRVAMDFIRQGLARAAKRKARKRD